MTELIILIALIVIGILAGSKSKILQGLAIGALTAAQAIGGIVFFLLIICAAGCVIWGILN